MGCATQILVSALSEVVANRGNERNVSGARSLGSRDGDPDRRLKAWERAA